MLFYTRGRSDRNGYPQQLLTEQVKTRRKLTGTRNERMVFIAHSINNPLLLTEKETVIIPRTLSQVLVMLATCRRSFCTARGFNIAVITGSSRTEGPPDPILGERVTKFIEDELIYRGHTVEIITPKQYLADMPLLQTCLFL